MPCYRIQNTRIELGKNTNAEYMLAALNALGLNALSKAARYHASGKPAGTRIFFTGGNYDSETGQLTLQGADAETRADVIKRAYMNQATQATVRKFGFQIKQTGPNKFQAIKRTL